MMNQSKKILIKLGGASLQKDSILQGIVQAVKEFRQFGYQVVIVHGGGPAINAELTKKGITWSFKDGQRVTTNEMMDTIEMVLSGSMNSRIVRALNVAGVPAMGLSGTDGGILSCTRASEALGQVGQIQSVNTLFIDGLAQIKGSPVPVIAPLGVGANGETYNINADWAATRLAAALKVEQLLFMTDMPGILNGDGCLLREQSVDDLQDLIEKDIVTGGMLTKVRAIQFAALNGIGSVRVLNAIDAVKGLWSDWVGTTCYDNGHAPAWLKYPPRFEELPSEDFQYA
ncbi:MAG: acetylglutamate kinase [Bdellovibrionaceae bacterium]|nr:acetylglutamate kinase [Pseudobdellovibrionaceae bacterium]